MHGVDDIAFDYIVVENKKLDPKEITNQSDFLTCSARNLTLRKRSKLKREKIKINSK